MTFVEDKNADERLGEYIARIRKERGMTLEDLSAVTKVTVPFLRSIEAGDWKAFPVEAYIRGYLNSISVKLNMDPKKVLGWYAADNGKTSQNPFEDVSRHEKIAPIADGEIKKRSKAVPVIIVLIGLAFLVVSRFLSAGDQETDASKQTLPDEKPTAVVDSADQGEIPEGAIQIGKESAPAVAKKDSSKAGSVSQAVVDEAIRKSDLPASATIFISSDSKKDSAAAPAVAPTTNKTSIDLVASGDAESWIGIKRREKSDRFLKEGHISKAGSKMSYSTEDTISVTIGEPRAIAKMILNGVETPVPQVRYGRVTRFRVYGGQIVK